jgi:prephenate dehydrogenase
MPIQITIIGLGRIGVSLGLALKRQAESASLKIIGHDRDLELTKKATARGAIDADEWNLPAACENADVIYLCVPLSALKEVLEEVVPNTKPGCVITDTAAVKSPVLEWAAAVVPTDRYYIGGTPIPNPLYLHENATGLEAAQANFFEGGLWALVPDANASPEALKLISDLAQLAGAAPFFVGALELDALMAGTHTLPALVAGALMGSLADSPEWADGRKMADRSFATATAPISFNGPSAVRAEALINSANVLRLLDSYLEHMQALRQAIAAGDEGSLESLLTQAALAREGWLTQRRAANWEEDELPKKYMPTVSSMVKGLFGLSRPTDHDPKDKK